MESKAAMTCGTVTQCNARAMETCRSRTSLEDSTVEGMTAACDIVLA